MTNGAGRRNKWRRESRRPSFPLIPFFAPHVPAVDLKTISSLALRFFVFLLVNHRLIFKCYQISSKLRRELLYYTRDTCTFSLSHVVDISRSERRRNETFQTFRHTKKAFFPRLKETMISSRHAMCWSATNSFERRV